MNIVKKLDQYNSDHIYFCDPIKNNIMNDGNFIRIMYSNTLFVLNGIYLYININHLSIDKYYNKFKCTFDVNLYKELIQKLYNIEIEILKKANINDKMYYSCIQLETMLRDDKTRYCYDYLHHF